MRSKEIDWFEGKTKEKGYYSPSHTEGNDHFKLDASTKRDFSYKGGNEEDTSARTKYEIMLAGAATRPVAQYLMK